jgi:hypothetical protein
MNADYQSFEDPNGHGESAEHNVAQAAHVRLQEALLLTDVAIPRPVSQPLDLPVVIFNSGITDEASGDSSDAISDAPESDPGSDRAAPGSADVAASIPSLLHRIIHRDGTSAADLIRDLGAALVPGTGDVLPDPSAIAASLADRANGGGLDAELAARALISLSVLTSDDVRISQVADAASTAVNDLLSRPDKAALLNMEFDRRFDVGTIDGITGLASLAERFPAIVRDRLIGAIQSGREHLDFENPDHAEQMGLALGVVLADNPLDGLRRIATTTETPAQALADIFPLLDTEQRAGLRSSLLSNLSDPNASVATKSESVKCLANMGEDAIPDEAAFGSRLATIFRSLLQSERSESLVQAQDLIMSRLLSSENRFHQNSALNWFTQRREEGLSVPVATLERAAQLAYDGQHPEALWLLARTVDLFPYKNFRRSTADLLYQGFRDDPQQLTSLCDLASSTRGGNEQARQLLGSLSELNEEFGERAFSALSDRGRSSSQSDVRSSLALSYPSDRALAMVVLSQPELVHRFVARFQATRTEEDARLLIELFGINDDKVHSWVRPHVHQLLIAPRTGSIISDAFRARFGVPEAEILMRSLINGKVR